MALTLRQVSAEDLVQKQRAKQIKKRVILPNLILKLLNKKNKIRNRKGTYWSSATFVCSSGATFVKV